MNPELLSQILELHYRKNISYCYECQHGNCINFMYSLQNYLLKYKQNNFEIGELQEIKQNGDIEECTHMFIKYDNLIFDSIRFGEKKESNLKSYFGESCDLFNSKIIYYKKNTFFDKENEDNHEEFNNIKKEIKIYGFNFLVNVYTIENDFKYKNENDSYNRNEDLDLNNFFDINLNKKQLEYLYDNKILDKLETLSKEYNRTSKNKINNNIGKIYKKIEKMINKNNKNIEK